MTQVMDSEPTAAPPRPPEPRRRIPRPAAVGRLLGLLAAAWLLPLLTHAVGVDWLILLVLVGGTAALLRVGRTAFDRLMFALILTAGVLVAGGVLFSLWPWGLEPVPVGGTLLTALVVAAAVTGRRPGFPVRVEGTDAVLLGFGAYTAYMLHKPLLGLSADDRLLYTVINDDRARHFSLFDAIHRVGGFTYFHADQARTSMDASMPSVYPPGSHYLYSVVDIFGRSSVDPGSRVAEYDRYVTYTTFGYAFMVVAVVWAARWVMGPTITGWRRALVCCTVATVMATGQFVSLFWSGHDATMLAVGLLAVTVALLARPPRDVREQVLLTAAAVVVVSFTYNMYVVFAAAGTGAALFVYRKRLTGHWRFTAVVALVAGPIAAIPVVGPQLTGFSQTQQLLAAGVAVQFSRGLVAAFVIVVFGVCFASRAGRRLPAWRVLCATLALSVLGVVLFAVYQHAQLGQTSYYFEKAVQGVFVIALVGFGAVALMLKPSPQFAPPETGPAPRRLVARAVPSIAAGLVAVLFAGGVQWGAPSASWVSDRYGADTNYLSVWADRRIKSPMGVGANDLAETKMLGDGRSTLVFNSDEGTDNWRITLFNAILNRDFGILLKPIDGIYGINGALTFKGDPAKLQGITGGIEAAVRQSPRPLRLLFANPVLAEHFREFAARNPDLRLEVRHVPALDHR